MPKDNSVIINVGRCRVNKPAADVAKEQRRAAENRHDASERENDKLVDELNRVTDLLNNATKTIAALQDAANGSQKEITKLKAELERYKKTTGEDQEPLPDPVEDEDLELKNPPARAKRLPKKSKSEPKKDKEETS